MQTNPALVTMADVSKIAERLRAHAKLCRQIASASWNEESAQELSQLADECARAAAEADDSAPPAGPMH